MSDTGPQVSTIEQIEGLEKALQKLQATFREVIAKARAHGITDVEVDDFDTWIEAFTSMTETVSEASLLEELADRVDTPYAVLLHKNVPHMSIDENPLSDDQYVPMGKWLRSQAQMVQKDLFSSPKD